MLAFSTCNACARHLKKHERACPFCGALLEPRSFATATQARRTRRAEWLARGSALALVGCTSGAAAGPPGAFSATALFTCPGVGVGSLEIGHGEFECAEAGSYENVYDAGFAVDLAQRDAALFCDRATQFCSYSGAVGECAPIAKLCPNPSGGYPFLQLACDSGTVSCPCGFWSGPCTDDDAGGLTVSGPCYGAPPARLERLARHEAAVA